MLRLVLLISLINNIGMVSQHSPISIPLISSAWKVIEPIGEDVQIFCSGQRITPECPRVPPILEHPYLQMLSILSGNLSLTHSFPKAQLIRKIRLNFITCQAESQNNTFLIYTQSHSHPIKFRLWGRIFCGPDKITSQNRSYLSVSHSFWDAIAIKLDVDQPPTTYPSRLILGQILIYN